MLFPIDRCVRLSSDLINELVPYGRDSFVSGEICSILGEEDNIIVGSVVLEIPISGGFI
jgi:hypothetical protein